MTDELRMQANVYTGTYEGKQVDTRVRWQGYVAAAINDLRNSDRSPYEQAVYNCLRSIHLTPERTEKSI